MFSHSSQASSQADSFMSQQPAFVGAQGRKQFQHGDPVSLIGRLHHVKVMASGWGIGRISTDDHGDMSVNGNALAGLTEKMTYEFSGTIEIHKTYGVQLKVDAVGLHIPSNTSGLQKFLLQNYKGVGKKAAEKIITHYAQQPGGLNQFRANLMANPYSMDFAVAGVKRKTSMNASEGLKSIIYMDIATKIGGIELGDKLLRKIAAYLEKPSEKSPSPVEKAWSILSGNPYALIRDLDGYAFRTADIVARKVGFDLTRVERTAALVTHAVSEGCNSTGHSYLTMADFNKIIHAIDPNVDVANAIEAAMAMNEPMVIDQGRFYTEQSYRAERSLAKNLLDRHQRHLRSQIHSGSESEVNAAIDEAQSAIKLTLDDSQRECVFGLLTSFTSIHTISAGPGCGKTTIMELVLHILQGKTKLINNPETNQLDTVPYRILSAAPTGKAAKVLNARISRFGAASTTIHTLLGVRGGKSNDENGGSSGEGMFVHNFHNKLDVDLLVIDETSMVDLALMEALLAATPEAAHIVFLGDPKQLPSVGPGSCLADLLALPFDHHQLTRTHRNDGGILEVVQLAGMGQVDFQARTDVEFLDGLPPADEQSIEEVINLYAQAIDDNLGDFSKVGLLIARRKGDPSVPGWNSTYLNAVLRERYNPELVRRTSINGLEGVANAALGERIYGTRYRVGDRMIIRKNLTLTQGEDEDSPVELVVNGDTGVIVDYMASRGNLTYLSMKLDDGRNIMLPSEHVDVLDFAYAMTVHTAQGSEYSHILFICVNGHRSFVHRGIVFTAFSRAKRHLTVIGDQDTIRSVVARSAPLRNSYLCQRFSRLLAKKMH